MKINFMFLRDCLGTLFRNSLTVGSLKKINNLFIKDIFHGYCLKRQSLRRYALLPRCLSETGGVRFPRQRGDGALAFWGRSRSKAALGPRLQPVFQ